MINSEISYLIAILTGILSSTHCIGMCGGITIFLSINSNNNKKLYYFIYNLSRVISYSLIGIMSGIFGVLITDLSYSSLFLIIRIISDISIINIGIYIIKGSNLFIYLENVGFFMWNNFQKKYIKHIFPIEKIWQAVIIGLIWGLIPCGIVYNVLIWTMTSESIIKSSFLMFLFGCGTLPAMLLTGYYASLYKRLINNEFLKKIFGILLIILGLISIYLNIFSKCH